MLDPIPDLVYQCKFKRYLKLHEVDNEGAIPATQSLRFNLLIIAWISISMNRRDAKTERFPQVDAVPSAHEQVRFRVMLAVLIVCGVGAREDGSVIGFLSVLGTSRRTSPV